MRLFFTWMLAAVASVGAAGHAVAKVYDTGSLTAGAYANAFIFGPGVAVSDLFVFDLGSPANLAGALSTVTLGDTFGLDDFKLQINSPTGFTLAFTPSVLPGGISLIDAGVPGLPAGLDYVARVTGNVSGTLGGGYTIMLAVAPVPEPTEWMMFVAGLMMVGVIAGRRSREML